MRRVDVILGAGMLAFAAAAILTLPVADAAHASTAAFDPARFNPASGGIVLNLTIANTATGTANSIYRIDIRPPLGYHLVQGCGAPCTTGNGWQIDTARTDTTSAPPTRQLLVLDDPIQVDRAHTIAPGASKTFSFGVAGFFGTPPADGASGTWSITTWDDDVGAPGGIGASASPTATLTADTTPPTISAITASPSLAKAGPVTLSFTTSEPLRPNPTVTVNAQPATFTSVANNVYSYAYTVPSSAPQGAASVAIAAADLAANQATATSTTALTIDTTAPTISGITASPALAKQGDTVTIGYATSEPLTGVAVTVNGRAATASTPAGTYTYVVGSDETQGAATLAVSGSDAAGNSASATSASALTIDTVAPTLSALAANPALAKPGPVSITFDASEALGAAPSVTVDGSAATFTSLSGHTYTYTYTVGASGETQGPATIRITGADPAGNAATPLQSSSILTIDTVPPTIANLAVTPAASKAGTVTIGFSAPEAFSANPVVRVNGNPATFVSVGAGRAYSYSYMVAANGETQGPATIDVSGSDAAGNLGGGSSSTALVIDTVGPAFTGFRATPTYAKVGSVGFAFTASEALDANPAVSVAGRAATFVSKTGNAYAYSYDVLASDPQGPATVSITASDVVGNPGSASIPSGIIVDTQAPTSTLTLSPASPNGAGGWYVSAVHATLTCNDANPGCDTQYRLASTDAWTSATGLVLPDGAKNLEIRAVDQAGNVEPTHAPVQLKQDTQAPALAGIADLAVEAQSSTGATVTYAPTATDALSTPTIACTPASGALFPLGATSVGCTATDAAGNAATRSFTVTVRDTTAPNLEVPSDIVAEAMTSSGATVPFTVRASDAVSGATPTCSASSGARFPLGDTLVTCSATDAAGNVATRSFHVKVRDTTAPLLARPQEIVSRGAGADGATVTYALPAASDAVSAPVVGCAPASGSLFPRGTTVVTCTATDAAGNSASVTFDVTVTGPSDAGANPAPRDSTPPQMSLPPDLTAEATDGQGALVEYAFPVASDASGSARVVCDHGPNFPLGETRVTCTATDAFGNAATGSFLVTVRDTRAPSIETLADITVNGDAEGATVTYAAPAASDAVSPPARVACAPASGTRFPQGATLVRCTATDAAGNAANTTFLVTVRPGVAVTLVVPDGTVFANATDASGANVSFNATASTPDGSPAIATCAPASGAHFAVGKTRVTCEGSSAFAASATRDFLVEVVHADTTPPPTPRVPTGLSLVATNGTATLAYEVPRVEGATVTCAPAPGAHLPVGNATVTCTATDKAGNAATATFPVHVEAPGTASAPSKPVPGITLLGVMAVGALVGLARRRR